MVKRFYLHKYDIGIGSACVYLQKKIIIIKYFNYVRFLNF